MVNRPEEKGLWDSNSSSALRLQLSEGSFCFLFGKWVKSETCTRPVRQIIASLVVFFCFVFFNFLFPVWLVVVLFICKEIQFLECPLIRWTVNWDYYPCLNNVLMRSQLRPRVTNSYTLWARVWGFIITLQRFWRWCVCICLHNWLSLFLSPSFLLV